MSRFHPIGIARSARYAEFAFALSTKIMPRPRQEWLHTTVNAVRELMIHRLQAHPLDPQAQREVQMVLEMLDVMWEELQGQVDSLTREHQRHSEFFDYAPDAYLVTDSGGIIREVNHAAAELLGLSQDALEARPLSHFLVEDDRVGFLSNIVGLLAGKATTGHWQARVQPGEGAPRLCDFSVRAIPLPGSGVSGLCWLIRPA